MEFDEDQDPVWELLAQARPVRVRPFFPQRTVAAARGESAGTGLLALIRSAAVSWKVAGAGVAGTAAVFLAVTLSIRPGGSGSGGGADGRFAASGPASVEQAPLPTLEEELLLDELDTLLDVKDPSEFSDDDLLAILFPDPA